MHGNILLSQKIKKSTISPQISKDIKLADILYRKITHLCMRIRPFVIR